MNVNQEIWLNTLLWHKSLVQHHYFWTSIFHHRLNLPFDDSHEARKIVRCILEVFQAAPGALK